eukprot:TRINITY_DN2422_c0_g2_i3.p2 TRINITY_DN2422_c0_g2~~TRINITY_DN2422_c0_g2_i3.p2  ORF type:complete len:203 (-),score=-19.90 TRINITY_DN2422_c0_g2_i3:302-910(-)
MNKLDYINFAQKFFLVLLQFGRFDKHINSCKILLKQFDCYQILQQKEFQFQTENLQELEIQLFRTNRQLKHQIYITMLNQQNTSWDLSKYKQECFFIPEIKSWLLSKSFKQITCLKQSYRSMLFQIMTNSFQLHFQYDTNKLVLPVIEDISGFLGRSKLVFYSINYYLFACQIKFCDLKFQIHSYVFCYAKLDIFTFFKQFQ